ncbi:hypothetical protein ACXVUM_20295 [Williamsia sp. SKLECPSW1]
MPNERLLVPDERSLVPDERLLVPNERSLVPNERSRVLDDGDGHEWGGGGERPRRRHFAPADRCSQTTTAADP